MRTILPLREPEHRIDADPQDLLRSNAQLQIKIRFFSLLLTPSRCFRRHEVIPWLDVEDRLGEEALQIRDEVAVLREAECGDEDDDSENERGHCSGAFAEEGEGVVDEGEAEEVRSEMRVEEGDENLGDILRHDSSFDDIDSRIRRSYSVRRDYHRRVPPHRSYRTGDVGGAVRSWARNEVVEQSEEANRSGSFRFGGRRRERGVELGGRVVDDGAGEEDFGFLSRVGSGSLESFQGWERRGGGDGRTLTGGCDEFVLVVEAEEGDGRRGKVELEMISDNRDGFE